MYYIAIFIMMFLFIFIFNKNLSKSVNFVARMSKSIDANNLLIKYIILIPFFGFTVLDSYYVC